jgi:hypothetical protein
MKTHILKIHPEYFKEVKSGKKTFEVRLNDRDYKVGDLVILREFISNIGVTEKDCYTGNQLGFEIGYIYKLSGTGDVIVFSLLKVLNFEFQADFK